MGKKDAIVRQRMLMKLQVQIPKVSEDLDCVQVSSINIFEKRKKTVLFHLCTYSKGDLIEEFNYQNFNLFFAGDYASWSEESVQKLKDYISNGGNVIFGSADDWRVGNREKRDPMRK